MTDAPAELAGDRDAAVDGAAAKLHAMVRAGEPWEGCPELPWPQLRSLLADLLRIDA